MENGFFTLPSPENEVILDYAPGSIEREELQAELVRQKNMCLDIPLLIGGKEIRTDDTGQSICPHNHHHVLAEFSQATGQEVDQAISSALVAKSAWEAMPWYDRASIFIRAADLVSGKYRFVLNAATVLNQSKNIYQAEIDSACELADFLRFNVSYMEKIYSDQPFHHSSGTWNRIDYRPLEGFVFAVTPFNFTAIAGNLPSSAAMMGNVVVWKPASTSVLSSWYVMQVLREAGLPDGVINFIPGSGGKIGPKILEHESLAGIHFTGSTKVFRQMWRSVAEKIDCYRTYPRVVGETGGKDFIFVHSSAEVRSTAVALARGAFEYQGQKCSATSRAYIPRSLWPAIRSELDDILTSIRIETGDPADFKFYNAVIDEAAFDRAMRYIEDARVSKEATIEFGGNGDKTVGYFVDPTVIVTENPFYQTMEEEIFAPVLTFLVYDDERFEETLELCEKTSPYGLTGAILATDRQAIHTATTILRHASGNFYINDKPSGAVVGQQPFGGGRNSGTNDKAGFYLNLLRWTSPRTIKETFSPPEEYYYPFMK